MITTNELRIGNIVDCKINGLTERRSITAIGSQDNVYFGDITYTVDSVYPIPLTAALLEACGFKKNEDLRYSNIWYFIKDRFTITQLRHGWQVSYGLYDSIAIIWEGVLFV